MSQQVLGSVGGSSSYYYYRQPTEKLSPKMENIFMPLWQLLATPNRRIEQALDPYQQFLEFLGAYFISMRDIRYGFHSRRPTRPTGSTLSAALTRSA